MNHSDICNAQSTLVAVFAYVYFVCSGIVLETSGEEHLSWMWKGLRRGAAHVFRSI